MQRQPSGPKSVSRTDLGIFMGNFVKRWNTNDRSRSSVNFGDVNDFYLEIEKRATISFNVLDYEYS